MNITLKSKEIQEGLLVYFTRLYPGSLEVFLVLCSEADSCGRVTIGFDKLVKLTGYSLFKVVKAIQKLTEANIIVSPDKGTRGKTHTYLLPHPQQLGRFKR